MYDIITDIWKNPGAVYSPFATLPTDGEKEEVLKEINGLHKKGVDSLFLDCESSVFGFSPFTEEYFDALNEILEYIKARHMLAVLPDFSSHADSALISSDKRYSARVMYAAAAEAPIPDGEELLFRVYLSFDGNLLSGIELGAKDGYSAYNLILGYSGRGRDLLNPTANEEAILSTLKKVTENVSPYLGSTVVGFHVTSPKTSPANGMIPWSYDTVGYFMENRGEFEMLPALLFDVKDKKLRREAEYRYGLTVSEALAEGYYKPLEKFTLERGVSLMGIGAVPSHKYFGTPGVSVSESLGDKEAAELKCASDSARHRGKAHSSVTLDSVPETACALIDEVNRLSVLGASMIFVPHSLYSNITPYADMGDESDGRIEYKKLSSYIKRLSWLNSTGTNNPTAAVLCSPEYIPTTPVAPLYKDGYTFNYLTLDDLMEHASVQNGKLCIDRYAYTTVLIDGRLRMNTEVVKKIGQFVTEGGKMYRGSDFIGYMRKHVKKTTLLSGGKTEDILFSHYTKSGCHFVSLVNTSSSAADTELVTDIKAKCSVFDLFSGKTSELSCALADGGFGYKLHLPAHSATVLGFDPNSLPKLGEEEKTSLCEIVSLADGNMSFDFVPSSGKKAVLSFREMTKPADAEINETPLPRFTFPPYEYDITSLLKDGENLFTVTPSDAFAGCTVRITEKK